MKQNRGFLTRMVYLYNDIEIPDQNEASFLYTMLEIHHSGGEPLIHSLDIPLWSETLEMIVQCFRGQLCKHLKTQTEYGSTFLSAVMPTIR